MICMQVYAHTMPAEHEINSEEKRMKDGKNVQETHSCKLQMSFTFIAMQYICYVFPAIKQYNR